MSEPTQESTRRTLSQQPEQETRRETPQQTQQGERVVVDPRRMGVHDPASELGAARRISWSSPRR